MCIKTLNTLNILFVLFFVNPFFKKGTKKDREPFLPFLYHLILISISTHKLPVRAT